MYRPSLILYAFDVDWGPLTPQLKALEEHCQNGNRAFGSARKFTVRGVFDRSYYRPILLVSSVQLYAIVLHGDGRRTVRKNTRASGTLHLVPVLEYSDRAVDLNIQSVQPLLIAPTQLLESTVFCVLPVTFVQVL